MSSGYNSEPLSTGYRILQNTIGESLRRQSNLVLMPNLQQGSFLCEAR